MTSTARGDCQSFIPVLFCCLRVGGCWRLNAVWDWKVPAANHGARFLLYITCFIFWWCHIITLWELATTVSPSSERKEKVSTFCFVIMDFDILHFESVNTLHAPSSQRSHLVSPPIQSILSKPRLEGETVWSRVFLRKFVHFFWICILGKFTETATVWQ